MPKSKLQTGWTSFPTPLGVCGVAWNTLGITRFLLPAENEKELHAEISRLDVGVFSPPPAWVRRTIQQVTRHFKGQAQDFSGVKLDFSGIQDFQKAVYQEALRIGPGECVTYGELAAKMGKPGAARAVGTALGRNPFALLVPCHRVVGSAGAGGFSAPGGLTTKSRMLEAEGVALTRIPSLTPAHIKSAARQLAAREPLIARLIQKQKIPHIQLSPHQGDSPYEVLLEAIVHQQLSPAAAKTILGRVNALGGNGRIIAPQKVLALKTEKLRAAGLSGAKVKAVKDLAKRQVDGLLPDRAQMDRLTDQGIVSRLTPIYGIGKWTVEMLLIFHLGRPDVLPVDDLALRNAFGNLRGSKKPPTRSEVEEFGEKWRPYRTVASLYLWQSIDVPKK